MLLAFSRPRATEDSVLCTVQNEGGLADRGEVELNSCKTFCLQSRYQHLWHLSTLVCYALDGFRQIIYDGVLIQ